MAQQLNQGYAAAWKRVRKTRLKKTGMTEFFQDIDREYRGYRRDAFVAEASTARNAKAQEDTFRRTLDAFRARFGTLGRAHQKDWTAKEARFLSDFHTVLMAEVNAWNRPLISEAIASRDYENSDDGKADKLELIARETRSALQHLGRTMTDVEQSASQVRDKFKLALGESAYRQYLGVLKEAAGSLHAQLKATEALRKALDQQIRVVGPSADRDATTLRDAVTRRMQEALRLAERAKAEYAGFEAALAQFVDGWGELERTVVAPRGKVKALLDAADTRIQTLVKARATLAFQRGVPPDAAARSRFDQLCTALPAARSAFEAFDKPFNALATDVKSADDRNLGAMPGSPRSPFVVAAKKDLLAWAQVHARARADLKSLEEFAATWRSLMGRN